jgi:hypothetical protein
VHGGGVEVLELDGERGQVAVAGGEVRREVDEAAVLGQRLAGVAAVAEQPGIGAPRLGMAGVQPEDVAELDRRPLGVARDEIGDGAPVVVLRPLGRAVAAARAARTTSGPRQRTSRRTRARGRARRMGTPGDARGRDRRQRAARVRRIGRTRVNKDSRPPRRRPGRNGARRRRAGAMAKPEGG